MGRSLPGKKKYIPPNKRATTTAKMAIDVAGGASWTLPGLVSWCSIGRTPQGLRLRFNAGHRQRVPTINRQESPVALVHFPLANAPLPRQQRRARASQLEIWAD